MSSLRAIRTKACCTLPVPATIKPCTEATHSQRSAATPAVASIDHRWRPPPYLLAKGSAEAVESPFATMVPPPAAPRRTDATAVFEAVVFCSRTQQGTIASPVAAAVDDAPSATPAVVPVRIMLLGDQVVEDTVRPEMTDAVLPQCVVIDRPPHVTKSTEDASTPAPNPLPPPGALVRG